MVEQVNNHDIIDAGNTIADLLVSINDNLIEQNERVSSNASMISNICRQLDELKEAGNERLKDTVHECMNDMFDGGDFIDGVHNVIDDYDMEDKIINAGAVTSNSFGDELYHNDVAYKSDLDDIDVDCAVRAILHDNYLSAAKEVDPDLSEVRERRIREHAVKEYIKQQEEKEKAEKESADKLATLPPLPQPSN